ncbi:hypothetical protein GCM10025867_37430 [Frondihabitans sucicola]|uniref:DUF2029 domain-containing protein n=1 Tax=Frondihabitans sucicola TaxID=1268041 RepID=A0ABN6Y2D0_9MICO|nr:hypothetical protein [Frondihabitans sucicola]BDZ51502.1 hypothetical protein GCM10025867_37430 [Frondihabitans sucicola]
MTYLPADVARTRMPAAEVRRRRPTARGGEILAGVLIAILLALVARLRLPPEVRATVWAEDGRVFLHERYDLGVFGSLFHPYQGYLQFVPRILTDIATAVSPLDHFATTVTALVCTASGIVACLVFWCSRDVVSSPWSRAALASITVLVPALPIEVLGNMANFHWLLLWLTPWLLLFRPRAWWQSGVVAVILLACALSEIQVALFLPLVLFSLRRPKSWPVSAALVVGVAAQIAALATHARTRPERSPLTALDVIRGYLESVVLPIANPSANWVGARVTQFGWWIGLLALIPFLVAAVILVLRTRGFDFVAIGAVAAGATVPWVAGALVNADHYVQFDHYTPAEELHGRILRYGVVPAMFLIALVVLAADRLLRAKGRAAVTVGVVALALTFCAQAVHVHVESHRRDGGPLWTTGVAAATTSCESGAQAASIPEAPSWKTDLSCAVVLDR